MEQSLVVTNLGATYQKTCGLCLNNNKVYNMTETTNDQTTSISQHVNNNLLRLRTSKELQLHRVFLW